MASTNTGIEWTDYTWNILRGCTRVSPGCGGPGPYGGCYAERLAMRFSGPGQPYHGLVKSTPAGPRWTGEVRFVAEALTLPLRWRTPRRTFVNSMSDLFHEKVTNDIIAKVFGVMMLAPQHTFQVLTKRPERMLAWMRWISECADGPMTRCYLEAQDTIGFVNIPSTARAAFGRDDFAWPLPNVWLGVSVEDQATARERWAYLRDTPAALRWISYEPALAGVDFVEAEILPRRRYAAEIEKMNGVSADWIVAGGESGPGARPPHPQWFRSARDQCHAANVPYFFKQWGEWAPHPEPPIPGMNRIGKKAAGALLDGREWREFPR